MMSLRSRLISILCALAVLAIGGAFGAPAHAGQPVALRPFPADENGQVTLGDLFDGAGEAGSIVIATGRAGSGMVLDAARVQMFARAHGLDWDNATGIRRLIVQPGAVRGERADASAITVTAPSTHAIKVLSYARDINPGEIVQADDLVWSRTALPMPDSPRDAQTVIGMAARRPLREGAAVAQHDVTAPQVIKKDDVIALVYSDQGVTLTLQGKALENAVAGQVFNALNPESKKILQAVATGPGQAAVGPQAEQLRAAARLNPSLLASLH